MQDDRSFDASVVVVIDYKAGGAATWKELRLTLKALAEQDFDGKIDFLLVEPRATKNSVPDDLAQSLPSLRIVYTDGTTSYDLKNAGIEAAFADFVVILDADCVPHKGWLSAVMRHHRAHPDAATISGKTLYRAEGLLPRIFALIDRSYVDCGGPGTTRTISNNNAAFRKDAMLAHPLRNELGPFGSKQQSVDMLEAGLELRFEPEMIAYHGYGGWPMQKHARHYTGFSMTRHRQLNDDATHAWMFKLGTLGLPLIFLMSIAGTWKNCLKRASSYGVRWFEVPVAMLVAIRVHLMEISGVRLALQNGELSGDGAFR